MARLDEPLDRIAREAHRRSRWAETFVDTILDNQALSFFSFFCCIPIVVFAPNVTAGTRLRLLGLWVATIALAVCVRQLFAA